MKKKWLGVRVIGGICAAFCWWGLLYPELTMTPDTYEVFYEEENVLLQKPKTDRGTEEELYRMLLETDSDRIRLKSRLLEFLRQSEESDGTEKCPDWRI